eukprot:11188243-Lingulodinium_polyedra.AAC.1
MSPNANPVTNRLNVAVTSTGLVVGVEPAVVARVTVGAGECVNVSWFATMLSFPDAVWAAPAATSTVV